MPTLQFSGHSDDTFGEYAHTSDDYDCCASGAMIVFRVECDGEGMNVCGQYSGPKWPDEMPGCWMIGLTQLEEDMPIPQWPMRWSYDGYTPVLTIDAPDGVELTCLNRKGEDT